MITVESVTRNFGAFTAVDDVGFIAEARRVTGIPRPQRRRQVDHHADPGRPDQAHLGKRHHLRGAATWTCPTPDSRSGCSSMRPRSTQGCPVSR